MTDRNQSGALARKHLDRRLEPLRSADAFVVPPKGWVRAIRDALGMTTRQLAARLGVAQSSVVGLEKSEAIDTISLKTLREAARALDCRLVYALVPNRPLEELVRTRARIVAEAKIRPVSHSMQLENQGVEKDDLVAERDRLAEELLRTKIRRLWDET